jgi:uncharacterized protein
VSSQSLISDWLLRKYETAPEHKKLIRRLSKQKDKIVSAEAEKLHNKIFKELDCLDCANCCKSIPPIINETDIKRAAKALSMKPGQFKDKYVKLDEDQDMVINHSPCPFLDTDNTCFIYEARPKACREYPHTDNLEFMKHKKLHAINAQYCPAVFHILEALNSKP